ncbi:hypothetical protein [Saccharopolyspora shandongensis]|uniref:hypothetical protein n=1 Tax=Saccharopolyspora shandongensis TaxID=418495 RepID=UPI0033CB2A8C
MSEASNNETTEEELGGVRYVPNFKQGSTQNTAYRDQNGVQTGILNGDVTMNSFSSPKEPELLVRRATDDEVEQARKQFVEPGGFAAAKRILWEHNVVVLCGPGTGRSFTARRLLDDCGASAIVEMSRQRKLQSVRASDLEAGLGYIWSVGDDGGKPFLDWEFEQCARLFKDEGCRLVIVLDHRSQSCSTASSKTVELAAPDLVEVALCALRWRCRYGADGPAVVLKSDLRNALEKGDPPEKAVRAAEWALRAFHGEASVDEALAGLREDIGNAVARWFEAWQVSSVREYAMSLAVAVLENEPYDRVVAHATLLDEEIRKAQLPEDKKLRPRRVFEKPKQQLLDDIQTETVERQHPRHTGLREETVRFKREGWAVELLCHVWREYPSIHPILHKWLVCVPGDAARRALCTITAKVPAHEPLRFVNELAAKRRYADRFLAAATLITLANDHNLQPLVEETLEDWTEYGGAYQQWTAAVVYASPFGQRDISGALTRLAKIGQSTYQAPQNAVVAGVLGMLQNPDIQELVMDRVLSWSEPKYRRKGLRAVALSLGLWLTGLDRVEWFDAAEVYETFDHHVRVLMRLVLEDPDFGGIAIERLSALAIQSQWDQDKAAELVRLIELAIPDLRWRRRRRAVSVLGVYHPTKRSQIRSLLKTTRKCQRRLSRVNRARAGASS